MSVYLPTPDSKTYVYDFVWKGQRYKDTTHQTTESEARLVEAKKKLALRQQAGGIATVDVEDTPTFSAWAGTTLAYQSKFITRPDILERTLRMVLAFWGAPPTTPIGKAAVPRLELAPRPHHNLRLGDPIVNPHWLEAFELWMTARQVGASARNSYLSACSDIYTCALQPQYRATTGISTNPFAGIRRSPTRTRVVTLTADQILTLVAQLTQAPRGYKDTASRKHIAHALCIAALAPKLRVSTILALEWAKHFDTDMTTITVDDHKTSGATGAPQKVPVSAQLLGILQDIKAAQPPATRFAITYRDGPVASVKKGLRTAVEAIGLTWGSPDGVTFHVMRHSIATLLANPNLVGALTERLRADVMGHAELRTTQKYTHLNVSVQEGPHEAISAALPGLRAAATVPARVGGKLGGPRLKKNTKAQQKHIQLVPPAEGRKRA